MVGLFASWFLEMWYIVIVGLLTAIFKDPIFVRDISTFVKTLEFVGLPMIQIWTSEPIRRFLHNNQYWGQFHQPYAMVAILQRQQAPFSFTNKITPNFTITLSQKISSTSTLQGLCCMPISSALAYWCKSCQQYVDEIDPRLPCLHL